MSVTKDIDSLTNSMMMAMEKEARKNGLAPVFHRLATGNRKIVRAMAENIVMNSMEDTDVKRR